MTSGRTEKQILGKPPGFTVSFTMKSESTGTTPTNSSTKKAWEKLTANDNKSPPDEIKQMSIQKKDDVTDMKYKLNPSVTILQRDNTNDKNHKKSNTTPLVNLMNALSKHFHYYTFRVIAGVIVTDLKGSAFQNEFRSHTILDLTKAAKLNNQRCKWFCVLPDRNCSMEGLFPSLFSLVHGVDVVTDYTFERSSSATLDNLTDTITQAASKITPLLCLLPYTVPLRNYYKKQSDDNDNNREQFYEKHKMIYEAKTHQRLKYMENIFSFQSLFPFDPSELLVVSHMAVSASCAHARNKYFLRKYLNYMRIAYTKLTDTDLASRIEKIYDGLATADSEPLIFLLMLKYAYQAATIIIDYNHNNKAIPKNSNHYIFIDSIIILCNKFSSYEHSYFVDLSNFLKNIIQKNYSEAFQLSLDMLKGHIQTESFLGSFSNIQTELLQLFAFTSKLNSYNELTCFVEKILDGNYVRASHFFTVYSQKKTTSSNLQLTTQQHEFLGSLNAQVCEEKLSNSLGYRNRRR